MRWLLALALFGMITMTAGCALSPSASPAHVRPARTLEPAFDGPQPLPPPDMTDDGPGSLVDVKPLPSSSYFEQVDAAAVRVVYRSTQGLDGKPTAVSGVVLEPPGKPPRGGWPILSFGHALTGGDNRCAPSLAQDLGGYAPLIAVLVQRGYVVTMTDYQGLGVQGFYHPVLDAMTLGNNMIDAVRATRRVVPSTSTRWAAYGVDQGGMAAWGAGERAATYGHGLEMVGATALSPLADLSGLADAAQDGTLTPGQDRLYALVLGSLAASPAALDLGQFRSDLAKDRWGALTTCALGDPTDAIRAAAELHAADLRPASTTATAELRDALTQLALPGDSSAPAAPVLVVYATDDLQLPTAWVEPAVERACARGQPVDVSKRIGDVTTLNDVVTQASLSWLQARFDGQRLATVCDGVA